MNQILGFRHSEETKKKMSLAETGFKHSDEAKKKMSLAKLGIKRKPFSDETKKRMTLAKFEYWRIKKEQKHVS